MKLNKIFAVFLSVALVLIGATTTYGQITGYEVVTKNFSGPGGSSAQASCPAGKVVVGGGCELYATTGGATLKDSYPFTSPTSVGNGWACRWSNPSNAAGRTAYAICADGSNIGSVGPCFVPLCPNGNTIATNCSNSPNSDDGMLCGGNPPTLCPNSHTVATNCTLPPGSDDDSDGAAIPTIISSNPPNGAIIAQNTSDVVNEFGVTFSRPLDSLSAKQFTVSSSGANNSVSLVRWAVGSNYALSLSNPLSPGERITISFAPSGPFACLGYLPGDVNQSGTTNVQDLTALNNCINSQNCQLWQADINRDGAVNSNDITTLLGLMNGSIGGTKWLNKTLPACPAGSVGVVPMQTQTASVFPALNGFLNGLRGALGR